MQHIPSTPLADAFASLRHSCALLPPAQALAVALLLRLLSALESLARAWGQATTRRRPYRRGKGPQPRDWMIACHPPRKLRPAAPPPPRPPHARKVRAPPTVPKALPSPGLPVSPQTFFLLACLLA